MSKIRVKGREGLLPKSTEQVYLDLFSAQDLLLIRSRAIETLRISESMEPLQAAEAWAEAFLHGLITKGLLMPLEVYNELKKLKTKAEEN